APCHSLPGWSCWQANRAQPAGAAVSRFPRDPARRGRPAATGPPQPVCRNRSVRPERTGPSALAEGSSREHADGGGRTGAPAAGPDAAAWTTGPVSVTREVAVPPVPQLLRIRSAAHPDEGYDRIVFDFARELPGYEIRYVDEVRQD